MRIFLIAVMVLTFSAGAKENSSAVVDEIQASFKNIKTISTHFDQVARSTRFGEKKSSGELVIKRPGKMLWNYDVPKGRIFVADGSLVTLYDPESKQALVSQQPKGSRLPAGFSFLMGEGNLSDFFRIEILQDEKNKAGNRQVKIFCKPKTESFEFKNLELTFIWAPHIQLTNSKTVDMLDSENEISFSKMKLDANVDSSIFDVKLPKGVPVVSSSFAAPQ